MSINPMQVRRLNGQFHPGPVDRFCRKMLRKGAGEPVYVDFDGISGIDRRSLEAIIRAAQAVGERRIRIIGISSALWIKHSDLWKPLGPIAVPPWRGSI